MSLPAHLQLLWQQLCWAEPLRRKSVHLERAGTLGQAPFSPAVAGSCFCAAMPQLLMAIMATPKMKYSTFMPISHMELKLGSLRGGRREERAVGRER